MNPVPGVKAHVFQIKFYLILVAQANLVLETSPKQLHTNEEKVACSKGKEHPES